MRSFASLLALPLALAALFTQPASAQITAVPSAMNFTGRLAKPDGNPVPDGTYSIRFSLWDALTGGMEKWNKTVANMQVKDGTFAVTLDTFPAGTFNTNLWLEIKIGTSATLTPRTPLVSVPYAMKSDLALTVPDGSLTASKFVPGELNNAVNGLAWLLGGNSGTDPATHFIGTTDNQPLEFRVNNRRVMRFDTFDDGNTRSVNVLGGYYENTIAAGVYGATIAGGGWFISSDNHFPNTVTGNFGTVSGGYSNTADGLSTIGGGSGNTAYGASTIGGGSGNTADGGRAFIGGGTDNHAGGSWSTIGGGLTNITAGFLNTVGGGSNNNALNYFSTVGGGIGNHASGYSATVGGGVGNSSSNSYSTVGGGNGNQANGYGATVAGGQTNLATNYWGTVAGGTENQATEQNDTVGGGAHNTARGSGSVIAGGVNNTVSGLYSSITGGYNNNVRGLYSVINGGINNTASGDRATIPGGAANSAGGEKSFAAGFRAKANHNGAFVWADSIDADFTSTAANQFLIRAGGGVGINTIAPQGTLDVNGAAFANYLLIRPQNAGTGEGGEVLLQGAGTRPSWHLDAFLDNFRVFCDIGGTVSNIPFAITPSGNVGIGTFTPAYKLDVNGQVRASNVSVTSDARYKQHIGTLDNALNTLLGLRGVTFDWRKSEYPDMNFADGRQIGFIAQEVEKVLPELVSTDKNGYKSVAYANLVPVLVEAIKAQQKQRAADLVEINGLKTMLKQLSERLSAVEAEQRRQK
jgi:hypothetical protein